jgi:copper chaperone
MSTTTKINVDGMSCGHCVISVTKEVRKLDGVTDVDVDVVSGTVQVTSDGPLEEADLHAAIDEAGYEVTP